MRLGVTIMKMCKSNSFVTIRKRNDEKKPVRSCPATEPSTDVCSVGASGFLIGREGDDSFGVVSFPNAPVDSGQPTQRLEFPPRGKVGRYRASTPNFGHDPASNARKWATGKQRLKFFCTRVWNILEY